VIDVDDNAVIVPDSRTCSVVVVVGVVVVVVELRKRPVNTLSAQYIRALSPTAKALVDGDPLPIEHVNPSRVIDVDDNAVIVPDSRTCSVVVVVGVVVVVVELRKRPVNTLSAQYIRALSPTAKPLVDGDPLPIEHVNPSRVIDVDDSAVIVPDSRTCSAVVAVELRIDALTLSRRVRTLPTSPTSTSLTQVTLTLSPRTKPAVAGESTAISQRRSWWRATTVIDAVPSAAILPFNVWAFVPPEASALALAKPSSATGTRRRRRMEVLSARHTNDTTLE
jgi:hypothetical protein